MPVHDWTRVPAGIFHHFHAAWITEIANALNGGVLPPDCYALAEQIVGGLGSDVLTLESEKPAGNHSGNGGTSGDCEPGGIALATEPPRVRFRASAEVDQLTKKKNQIAIRHISDDRVLAVLEIVSPGNKSSVRGMRSFVEKTLKLLEAGIHLLLVDLFPPTPRDPLGIHGAIWGELTSDSFELPADEPLTLVAYSAGAIKEAFIEPAALGAKLPEMPLFLESDRYVPTPLEPTYTAAFAAVPRKWQEQLV